MVKTLALTALTPLRRVVQSLWWIETGIGGFWVGWGAGGGGVEVSGSWDFGWVQEAFSARSAVGDGLIEGTEMRCRRSGGVRGERYVPSGGTYLGGCVPPEGTERVQNVSEADGIWAKTSGRLTFFRRCVGELHEGVVGLGEGVARRLRRGMAEICPL